MCSFITPPPPTPPSHLSSPSSCCVLPPDETAGSSGEGWPPRAYACLGCNYNNEATILLRGAGARCQLLFIIQDCEKHRLRQFIASVQGTPSALLLRKGCPRQSDSHGPLAEQLLWAKEHATTFQLMKHKHKGSDFQSLMGARFSRVSGNNNRPTIISHEQLTLLQSNLLLTAMSSTPI